MDNLNNIPNAGNWGDAASKLNDNFNKVKQAVTTVENTSKNNKGYFTSLSALNTAFPSPKAGQTAYVYGEMSSTKYYIYNAVNGAWVTASIEAPPVGVDIAGYAKTGGSPKTLKQVEDDLVQLEGNKVSKNPGKNLFNPDAAVVGILYYENEEYGVEPNPTYFYTDYIPIDENGLYSNRSVGTSSIIHHIYYDINKNIIGRTREQIIPYITNAEYVRCCYNASIIDGLQIEKGDKETEYEVYSPIMGYPLTISGSQIVKGSIEEGTVAKGSITPIDTNFLTVGSNMFDIETAIYDCYISSGNGTLRISNDWAASGWIPVEGGESYVLNIPIRDRAFYGKNRNYISGDSSINPSNTPFTAPVNAEYFRFSVRPKTVFSSTVMMNKGTEVLPFEKYGYKLKKDARNIGQIEKKVSDFDSIAKEFNLDVIGDSRTSMIPFTYIGVTPFNDISGTGGVFNKSEVNFNAIHFYGGNVGALVPDDRKPSYVRVFVKNAKEDADFLAISPFIPVDGSKEQIRDITAPLMDVELNNIITLNDDSFSGETYFVGQIWYNKDMSYAYAGTSMVSGMANFTGSSFYTTNDNLTTWSPWVGNHCPYFDHLLIENPKFVQRLTYVTDELKDIDNRVVGLENSVGTTVRMQLPKYIDMVVGDTLQLYYSSLIAFPNWEKFHFAATIAGGKDLRRYVEFVPDTVGNRTLTISMFDENKRIIDTKSTIVRVKAAVKQPTSLINFWTVGDSLTNNPTYTNEMVRRLTETGGTPAGNGFGNIVNNREGASGKHWNWFVNSPDSPFVFDGEVDFEQYRVGKSLPVPQVVYIVLTWNGMGSDRNEAEWTTWTNDVYLFIDKLKEAFPNVEVKLCSPPFPSSTGGLGWIDGANIEGYPNIIVQNTNALKMAEIYERISLESGYSDWIEHINTALVVDSKYNMAYIDRPVNTRNPVDTEMIGTNDVHPNEYGYFQMADALYRNFIVNYCQ